MIDRPGVARTISPAYLGVDSEDDLDEHLLHWQQEVNDDQATTYAQVFVAAGEVIRCADREAVAPFGGAA